MLCRSAKTGSSTNGFVTSSGQQTVLVIDDSPDIHPLVEARLGVDELAGSGRNTVWSA